MAAKTSRKPKRKAPKYHRLTREQRIIIETLRKEGYSIRPIAVRLGVSPATVSRKLRRNRSKKGYRNRKADAMARHRARQKAGKRRKLTEQMWSYAMEKVRLGWSFAMACGRAGRDGVEMVCAEALYKEYYRRQKLVAEGKSQQKLPPLPKSHRKRHKHGRSRKEAGRGHIPGRVDISERPESVESRARGGHFEGDLINGLHGTGNLVTLAERMTRFTFFDYVESKESEAVMEVVLKLLGPLPPDLLKTLTFDNGKEFARFRVLEALGLKVYFARPRGLAHPAARPAPPAPPPDALRPALRATCRASTRRKNGLSGEPGGATIPPIHTEAPAWAGYAAGVALASCCREVLSVRRMKMKNNSADVAQKSKLGCEQRAGLCSTEVLVLLNAIKKAKEEENARFDDRMKNAIEEIEEKSRFRTRVYFAAASVVVGILGYFATAGISCVVRDKVNAEFDKYTKQQIDLRIASLSSELHGRIVECTNAVGRLDRQLHLLHLNSLALGGDLNAYETIKKIAQNDKAAQNCLSAVDAYFASLFHRLGPNYCMNEMNWDYRKVEMPLEEKLRRINEDSELSKENLNLLIGIVADHNNGRKFAGLLVRKMKCCTNLFDRTTLIDCLHALFENCPRTPDVEKVSRWWEENGMSVQPEGAEYE